MMIGSLLSYVGWFFFAAWSAVVGAINIAVFGKELLPSKAEASSVRRHTPCDPIQRTGSGMR